MYFLFATLSQSNSNQFHFKMSRPGHFEPVYLKEFPPDFNSDHWFPIDHLAIARMTILQGVHLAVAKGDSVYTYYCQNLSAEQRRTLASELIDRFPGRIRYTNELGMSVPMEKPRAADVIFFALKLPFLG
jgi:hypothetical protein